MSYTVRTTRALILKSFALKEADRVFELYTRDFGRITADATGIRLLKSKLRFALQTHSLAIVSLVRGRRDWKIVNALPVFSRSAVASTSKQCLIEVVNRLIAGELRDDFLFDFVESALIAPDGRDPALLYEFAILSMLSRLGYYDPPSSSIAALLMQPPSEEVLRDFQEALPVRGKIVSDLLLHTHL